MPLDVADQVSSVQPPPSVTFDLVQEGSVTKSIRARSDQPYVFFGETDKAIQRTHTTVQTELTPSGVTLTQS